MTAAQYLTAGALLVSMVGAYVAWRKWRPETTDITVTSADKLNTMTLRFAGEVNEDNTDLRAEIKALRTEFTQYRIDTESRLAELGVELRAEKAEKELVKQENERLTQRVRDLEHEVERLKRSR